MTDSERDVCGGLSDRAHSQVALRFHGTPPGVCFHTAVLIDKISALSPQLQTPRSAVEECIFEGLFLWGDRARPLSASRLENIQRKEHTDLAKAVYLPSRGSFYSADSAKITQKYNLASGLLFVLHINWINRGINIPASQLAVRCRVMITFSVVAHVVVNTVFSRNCVVAMAALLITVMIQLCVLH